MLFIQRSHSSVRKYWQPPYWSPYCLRSEFGTPSETRTRISRLKVWRPNRLVDKSINWRFQRGSNPLLLRDREVSYPNKRWNLKLARIPRIELGSCGRQPRIITTILYPHYLLWLQDIIGFTLILYLRPSFKGTKFGATRGNRTLLCEAWKACGTPYT